eukprot:gnl/Hemi2/17731_TR5847_c0_g1_i1.p1 gnl/Hemi2/17731_TR5847_c0_g1~~gnl/Hemi2/17731_TR5847_c0_g1_i1.p1  ORF type:complete len:466 (-),score=113.31 gnl/Hemi2/17731_TR5847_c0_g1_i1:229-1626(-)
MSDWIRRLKQKMSQTFGSAEPTVDPVFDDFRNRYHTICISLDTIHEQSKLFWEQMKNMTTSGATLAQAVQSFYAPQSRCYDAAAKYTTVFLRLQEFRAKLDETYKKEVIEPIRSCLESLPALKEKSERRDRRLLVYDYYQRKLKDLKAKQGKKKEKDASLDKQCQRNEEKLNKVKIEYEDITKELINEYQNLEQRRQELINRPFLQMMACQFLYYEAAEAAFQDLGMYLKFSELIDKNKLRQTEGQTSVPMPVNRTASGSAGSTLVSPNDPFAFSQPQDSRRAPDHTNGNNQDPSASGTLGRMYAYSNADGTPAPSTTLSSSPRLNVSNLNIRDSVRPEPAVSLPTSVPWQRAADPNAAAAPPVQNPAANWAAPGVAAAPPQPAGGKPPYICQAQMRYDFNSADPEDLSPIPAHAIVNVLEKLEEDGWWRGEYQGRTGTFPSNFCIPVGPPLQGPGQQAPGYNPF